MKKLLALVLALVMVLSLCVVSSNAAYKDAADVELDEAVDVLTAVGVFQGSDGKFDPKANLTREQAAKLVSYLQIGQKAADALVGGSKFTDVAKDRWSAGYVDYCASIGIAAGVGAGKFDPTGSLTALQFGKMLLVCLGYDAKSEGMVGTDWTINTSKLMASAKLLGGLDSVNANSVVTREQAAQMMLNALKAPMVEYANRSTSISVNGADIVFGGSTASYVTDTIASRNNIYDETTTADKCIIELGEKLFSKLLLKPATDDFGRPANKWTLNGKKIGTYAKTADYTYTTKVTQKDLYSDLGLTSDFNTTTEYYVDGKPETNFTISKTNTSNKIGGNGVVTEFYVDTNAKTLKCIQINTYAAQVANVVAATSTADRYITLTKLSARTDLNTKFETESFAKKDFVSYTCAWDGTEYDIQSVKALTKTEAGVMTAYTDDNATTSGASFTAGGTTYKYSAKAYVKNTSLANAAYYTLKDSKLDVYLDDYGYALYVEGTKGETNYAVVLGFGTTNAYGSGVSGATLLLPDGTIKEVTAKAYDDTAFTTYFRASNAKQGDAYGDIVTYTVNDDGVYVLTKVATGITTTTNVTNVTFKNGESKLTLTDSSLKYADDNTIFFVATGDTLNKQTFAVYKGYKAMPSVSAADNRGFGYVVDSENSAKLTVVYLASEKLAGTVGVDAYVSIPATVEVKSVKDISYVTLPAVVKGEKTTVDVKWDQINGSLGAVKALSNVVKNSDNIITSCTVAVPGTAYTGTTAADAIVVGVQNAYYAYTEDTEVYVASNDYKTFEVKTVADIETDGNDNVWVNFCDAPNTGVLKNVVIHVNPYNTVDAKTPAYTTLETASYAQNGTAVALDAIATGGGYGTVTYQWYKNGVKVAAPTGTAATLTPAVDVAGTATYYCVITNTDTAKSGKTVATTTTNTATITVYAPMTVVVEYVDANSGLTVKTLAAQEVEYGNTAALTFTFEQTDVPEFALFGYDNSKTLTFESGKIKTVEFPVEAMTLPTVTSTLGSTTYWSNSVRNVVYDSGTDTLTVEVQRNGNDSYSHNVYYDVNYTVGSASYTDGKTAVAAATGNGFVANEWYTMTLYHVTPGATVTITGYGTTPRTPSV